jgi:hypothetical protein
VVVAVSVARREESTTAVVVDVVVEGAVSVGTREKSTTTVFIDVVEEGIVEEGVVSVGWRV